MIDLLQFVTVREAYHNGFIQYAEFCEKHQEMMAQEIFDVRPTPEQKAPAHRAFSAPQSSDSGE